MKPNGESAAYEQHAPNVKVYNYNWLVLMPAAPEEWPQLNCIVGGTAARMNGSLDRKHRRGYLCLFCKAPNDIGRPANDALQ
jgi:hypothetical protein